jgi:hypothetical protein
MVVMKNKKEKGNFMKTKSRIFVAVMALMSFFLVPEMAMAATFGDVAGNIEGSVGSFKTLVVQIGFFMGIVLFVIGLFMIYRDSKEPGRGHLKNGLIAMIVGAGLLGMQTMIDTTLETGFGESGTSGVDKSGFSQ